MASHQSSVEPLRETSDPDHDFSEKRTYAWARDERGRCYLKSCRIDRHRPRRGGGLWYYYEVIRFNPDKRPSRSDFDDRAIRVAPGTVVEDQIAGKRHRVGDNPVADTGASLDGLVPELKSRGFAAPKREP